MSLRRYRTARVLGVGFGLLGLFGAPFAVGVAVEHYRTCGTEWHRKQTVHLAQIIASMRSEQCCHD